MATISNVNGKKITKIKYKGEIFDTGGSGVNPLQHIIDNHKGDNQPSGEDLFYEYLGSSLDEAISSCDFSKITSAKQMFYYCTNLTSIPYFDTRSCSDMERMFIGCSNLSTIPQLDTSSATNMSYMFYNCSNLITIPVLNTDNCSNVIDMFYKCTNLTVIPQLNTSKCNYLNETFRECRNLITIPQLDTRVCFSMKQTFFGCVSLTTIDITHMKITSTSNNDLFAYYCASLTKFIIRNMDTIPVLNSNAFTDCFHFTGTVNSTYNPQGLKDGRIYVPDDKVDELKVATNWSVFADIIVPLSTLVE